MKTLFGTVGCISISTLWLDAPASRAVAATHRQHQSQSDISVSESGTPPWTRGAARRFNTRGSGVCNVGPHSVAAPPQARFTVWLDSRRLRTFKQEKQTFFTFPDPVAY
jgi:hypothetical protein